MSKFCLVLWLEKGKIMVTYSKLSAGRCINLSICVYILCLFSNMLKTDKDREYLVCDYYYKQHSTK